MRKDWASCGKTTVIANQGERKYFALENIGDLLVIAAGGPAGENRHGGGVCVHVCM